MPTIKVSSTCYNEMATALEKQGLSFKLNVTPKGLTILEDVSIVDPVDWRAATVRKDCVVAAVSVTPRIIDVDKNIIEIAEEIYKYVLTGKVIGNE